MRAARDQGVVTRGLRTEVRVLVAWVPWTREKVRRRK